MNQPFKICGLSNLGNTCYINACLQILSHTPELNQLLNDEKLLTTYLKKPNINSVLLVEWNNLRKMLWNNPSQVISPNKFIKILQLVAKAKNQEIFAGYEQNDIGELFIFIIDTFHESLARKTNINIRGQPKNNVDLLGIKCYETIKNMYSNNYSELFQIFYGIQVTQLKNVKTQKVVSTIPETFMHLNLTVPNTTNTNATKNTLSLLECIDEYGKTEIMEGENAWMDENTNTLTSVEKYVRFWSFPTILAIHLKRYTNSNKKNKAFVDFPIEDLDLSPYVVGYNSHIYHYELYGICNHSGGTSGGHYTAHVKCNKQWFLCNDTMTTPISPRNLNSLITTNAYYLFYRQKTTKS